MELNREEIIKSFARCVNGSCSRATCSRFDSDETVGHRFCQRKIYLDALALLKELAKENEELRGLYEYNSKLAIDTERKLVQYQKSYKNELSHAHMLLKGAWESIEQKDQLLGTIKADTVREMSERLKEYLDDFYNSGEDALLDVPDLIDQIAKEILEEKK